MSIKERRALALLLGLAVAGHLIRAVVVAPPDPPAQVTLLDPALDGDPLAHRDSILHLSAPLAAGERIDAERASAEELARIPGLGPVIAKRIVADRQNQGAFGGLSGLDRVPGVGPAALARWSGRLMFNGIPAETEQTNGPGLVDLNLAGIEEFDALPGVGGVKARAIVAFRDSAGPFRGIEELRRVPGFSSSLVARLLPRLVVR